MTLQPLFKIFLVIFIVVVAAGAYLSFSNKTADAPQQPTGESQIPPQTQEPTSNVTVDSPKPGETITSPVVIKGQARVFENNVSLRVKYADGRHILTDFTTALAPDIGQFGPYETTLFLPKLDNQNVILEVYWGSPKDGSDLDVVSIPLKVASLETTKVKVYFNNDRLDPEAFDCIEVFPVTREMSKTQSVAELAVIELLKGPNTGERAQNYFTSIPAFAVRLNSLKIQKGTAFADFNEWLDYEVAGSCRVQAIRSQIEQTLKQFPSIRNVIISINGRIDDILQP
ncbi:hypothetical protein C4553_02795 [Candidatus Parcubacteria bacterium]|nr:MAG: hypothetical protein C4553_02795 [Candidatus Parcubacteria bacterium]